MTKYEHLHAKIKSVRQTLGLKQKDFAVKVSEQLGREGKPLSAGLASQWEHQFTTPTPEQIAAIANLTKTPEWHMIWFMLDQVPANRGVQLHPDGAYEFPFEAEAGARPLSQFETNPFQERLTEWKNDPRKIHQLRAELAAKNSHQQFSKSRDATDQLTDVSPSATAPDEVHAKSIQKHALLEDILKFKSKGPHEIARLARLSLDEKLQEETMQRDTFMKVLTYTLEEVIRVGDVAGGIDREFVAGAIRTKLDFYALGVAAKLIFLNPTRPIRFLRFGLREELGNLLLVDRMKGKSAKKLIVYCTYETGLDLSPVKEHFSEIVPSVELLNFKLEFASGPEQAAHAIASLSKSTHDSR